MDSPQLMTVREFLAAFRISRSSFYREINAGRLRVVKLGRATLVTRDDAEHWMANLPEIAGARRAN